VSSSNGSEMLEADVRYYRERLSLLRAKLYRQGSGSSSRLRELERELELAEQRLHTKRLREAAQPSGPAAAEFRSSGRPT
jgi:hypothetical protein